MVKHRNKRFGESNVPNDLIPDEIAIKAALLFCGQQLVSCVLDRIIKKLYFKILVFNHAKILSLNCL